MPVTNIKYVHSLQVSSLHIYACRFIYMLANLHVCLPLYIYACRFITQTCFYSQSLLLHNNKRLINKLLLKLIAIGTHPHGTLLFCLCSAAVNYYNTDQFASFACSMNILLLETPCSSVRSLVGHVFYPHLTRTHTNLMCERAR